MTHLVVILESVDQLNDIKSNLAKYTKRQFDEYARWRTQGASVNAKTFAYSGWADLKDYTKENRYEFVCYNEFVRRRNVHSSSK